MNHIVLASGGWIIFDGVLSMIVYKKQSWMEQTVRVIRTLIGVTLVTLGGIYL